MSEGDDAVLDASVVADLLAAEGGDALRDLLPDGRWYVPAHLEVEVVSALRGLVLGGHLTEGRAAAAVLDLCDLDLAVVVPHDDSLLSTLELLHHLTAHDAAYVVLARELDVPLVTRDARLRRGAGDLVDVVVV